MISQPKLLEDLNEKVDEVKKQEIEKLGKKKSGENNKDSSKNSNK